MIFEQLFLTENPCMWHNHGDTLMLKDSQAMLVKPTVLQDRHAVD